MINSVVQRDFEAARNLIAKNRVSPFVRVQNGTSVAAKERSRVIDLSQPKPNAIRADARPTRHTLLTSNTLGTGAPRDAALLSLGIGARPKWTSLR